MGVPRYRSPGITMEATRYKLKRRMPGDVALALLHCALPYAFVFGRCLIVYCPGNFWEWAAHCHEGLLEPDLACRLGSDTVG